NDELDGSILDNDLHIQEVEDFIKLKEAFIKIKPYYKWQKYFVQLKERKGVRREWAGDGHWIFQYTKEIWARAGRTRPLSINPGGALVHVLVQALRYQGWDINEAGVTRWLEQQKKISTKSRAISSAKREKSMGK
ncbi:MAG TPA: hypothetical protein PLV07_08605, partial [Acidiphilium sp.]|nr:hypothetical protein [Acidiphilium sp.]